MPRCPGCQVVAETLAYLALFQQSRAVQLVSKTIGGAGAITIDTGFRPPAGASARVDVGFNAKDLVAGIDRSGNGNVSIRNVGGPVVANGFFAAPSGDALLALTTIVAGVSLAGTLTFTLTPPPGYANDLEWAVTYESLIN